MKQEIANLIEEINQIEINYIKDLFKFFIKIDKLINNSKNSNEIEQLKFFKNYIEEKIYKSNTHKFIEQIIIFGKLQPRQLQIVSLIYDNPTLTAEDLSKILYISKDTLNQHLKNIIENLEYDKEISNFLKKNGIEFSAPLTTIKKIVFLQFNQDFIIKYLERFFKNLVKFIMVKNGKATKIQQDKINTVLTQMNIPITNITNHFSEKYNITIE